MKYDDIILECLGDCEECNVYLECQYQTSSGREKEEFLKKLLERDETIKSFDRPTDENPESLEEIVEKETEETTVETIETPTVENEVVEVERDSSITEAETEAETEIEGEVKAEVEVETEIVEEAETDVEVEPAVVEEAETDVEVETEPVQEITAEVLNDEESKTADKILLTPITQEEVDKIYSEVFGLSALLVDDEKVEEEGGLTQERVVSSDENLVTASSLPVEKEEDSFVQPEKEELTPPSKEQIDAVYAEVFKLNEERPCILEETETATTVKEENADIVCDDIADEKQTVIPITQEEADEIYSEVFNLTATRELSENQIESVANLPQATDAETTAEVTTEVVSEVTAETTAEVVSEVTAETTAEVVSEVTAETTAEVISEVALETVSEESSVIIEEAVTEIPTEIKEDATTPSPITEEAKADEQVKEEASATPVKETFKLTPPENNEELMQNMCAKRGRKLIYKPSEAIVTKTFKVLGTDKKNDIGEKVKDILDAEIKQGVKVGYLDKFDGLSSSEIKEEYENDIVYEFADQEFKKTGVIYDGKKIKVYVYDWDGKACHHIGYVDVDEAAELIPYFTDKEKYSFDVCGIITGGKGKRVVKEGNNLKIVKEKGDPIGVDVDVAILNRKD